MSANLLLINHECGQKKVCMRGGNVNKDLTIASIAAVKLIK